MPDKIFQRPETVPTKADVKDWDGEYVDPTSIKITVTIGSATVVDAQDMTKLETGKYVYYYTPAADATLGWHVSKVTVTDGEGGGAKVTITPGGFRLE